MDAGGLLFLFLFWLAVVDAATHLVTMVVAVATAVVAATMVADAKNNFLRGHFMRNVPLFAINIH